MTVEDPVQRKHSGIGIKGHISVDRHDNSRRYGDIGDDLLLIIVINQFHTLRQSEGQRFRRPGVRLFVIDSAVHLAGIHINGTAVRDLREVKLQLEMRVAQSLHHSLILTNQNQRRFRDRIISGIIINAMDLVRGLHVYELVQVGRGRQRQTNDLESLGERIDMTALAKIVPLRSRPVEVDRFQACASLDSFQFS